MPAGDAQRAWFPEMLSELKEFWSRCPTWGQLIEFCEQMTDQRTMIRQQLGIRPIRLVCRNSGEKHEMSIPPVSPRSLLFALKKIDAIDDEELECLDKAWAKYRKTHDLDVRGHPKGVLP